MTESIHHFPGRHHEPNLIDIHFFLFNLSKMFHLDRLL